MSWVFLAFFIVFAVLAIVALVQREWIATIGAAVLGYSTFRSYLAGKPQPPASSPHFPVDVAPQAPQVVVNVPKDYKPLETLEGSQTTLVGERALLWWTVYRQTLYSIDDVDTYDVTKAVWAANQAVEKVYGVES